MAIGRPSKFASLDLKQVQVLVLKGFTDAEMAAFFGVAESTWHKWKKDFPAFSESLKTWKDEADSIVERSLYERATGYSHPEEKIFCDKGGIVRADAVKHYPPDTTACIFWLKNRQPREWRDKVDLEHAGPNGGPIQSHFVVDWVPPMNGNEDGEDE